MMKTTSPIDKPLQFVQFRKTNTTAPSWKSATKTPNVPLQESKMQTPPSIFLIMNTLFKNTKLAPGTKATSSKPKETDTESSSTKMEATTKASGKTTKWTAGENSSTKEENSPTKETGAKTSSTDLEKSTTTTPSTFNVALISPTSTF